MGRCTRIILLSLLSSVLTLAACGKKSDQAAEKGMPDKKGSWSIFRGNNQLTGVSRDSIADQFAPIWSYKTGDQIKSSPVIGQGKVFIGSNDGFVYALNLDTGAKIWRFNTQGDVEAAPLLLDSLVFVGSVSGFFYALRASDGRLVWQYETDGQMHGSANWIYGPDKVEKWILAGSYDNKLYCFQAKTGRLQWTYETDYFINGTPATDGKIAVFGGCDEVIHIVSVLTGEKVGVVPSGAYIAGSAALLDGKAYLGHYGDKLISIDIAGQKIEWEYGDKKTEAFFSSPAVTESYVLIGGRDRYLHCVDRKNGKKIWQFQTRDDVDSSPVICGNKVIICSKDGRVYLVDLEKGSQRNAYEIGAAISGSPAVYAGKIVIGAEDGIVYAFGENL